MEKNKIIPKNYNIITSTYSPHPLKGASWRIL